MQVIRRGLLCWSLCGSLLASWGAWRVARAELSERALAATESVLNLPGVWLSAAPRELWLNGARVRIATGTSELALPALLDRLEGSCRARSRIVGGPARAWLGDQVPALLDGVLRAESGRGGLVACFELGPEPIGVRGLLHRLGRLASSLDLTELGGLRVVRVAPRAEGAFFVAAWSEGALPLARMFPARGDAPGFDSALHDRPEDARRTLSVLQQGGEPLVTFYETRVPRAFARYVERLHARGFARLDDGSDATSALLQAHGETLLVVGGQENDARAQLALIALAGGFARNRALSAPIPRAP